MAKAIPTHEQIRSALERLRPLGIRQLRYEVSVHNPAPTPSTTAHQAAAKVFDRLQCDAIAETKRETLCIEIKSYADPQALGQALCAAIAVKHLQRNEKPTMAIIACAVAKPLLQKCAEVAGVGILQYDAELNAFRVVVQPREV